MVGNPIIEQMTFDDLQQVFKVEQETPSPWSLAQLEAELHQPSGWQFVAHCPAGGKVIGYVCGRRAVDEGEILKIAVAVTDRRQGLASSLLERALHYLAEEGVANCYLEMRASNTPANNFYAKYGFVEIAVREKYYSDPQEDAVIMVKKIKHGGEGNR